jgi:hypothetical protein
MKALKQFVKHEGLVFHSKQNGPLAETTILTQALHSPLKHSTCPKRECMRSVFRKPETVWYQMSERTRKSHIFC